MLPGSIGLLQQYLQGQTPLIDAGTLPAPTEAPLLTLGERLQAIVRNELPGGRFLVQIKDQLLDLNLPRNTEPGTTVELEVVSASPTLRFALLQGDATPRPATTLSSAARVLAELLRPGEGKPAGVDPVPLMARGAAPDAMQLAARLTQVVNDSGIFYESHQADWARGERPLQALMREPQNNLPEAREPVSRDAGAAGGTGDGRLNDAKAVLGQLVQRQLDTLDQNGIIWQGQAWQGQPLRWTLNVEAADEHAAATDDAQLKRWQTRLDLDLPRLGSVSVVAELQGGRFNIRFIAPSDETRAALQGGQPALAARFAAAGLALAATPAIVDGPDE
ncbi:flagellar hook-length control protein FliK [Jeongeupia sp. USM3]|uniref:flagellar hook-length control protein FliK n=1 Tax=Jeongeupia sp. USM3 TaxID=1906741 RepID=UPI00089DFE70|nr:flagellar hook-length control protein FliK [Jeongeupia sp. USM3]AOX99309.1 hypothetical protein BJP62_01875 [Jeongeupia sp. USM3]